MLEEIRFYVDRPGRELTIPRPGNKVYIDIEEGCFEEAEAVREEGTRLTAHQLVTGIYTNHDPFQKAFGASTECADWPCPLWYAGWNVVPFEGFEAFNGWHTPELWQVSDAGFAGINVDVSFDPQGRLWLDFGNYTTLERHDAYYVSRAAFGVVIGLQDPGLARYNYDMLTR
jgi:hypothetical protein